MRLKSYSLLKGKILKKAQGGGAPYPRKIAVKAVAHKRAPWASPYFALLVRKAIPSYAGQYAKLVASSKNRKKRILRNKVILILQRQTTQETDIEAYLTTLYYRLELTCAV